ncbi:hypothetical protein Athai_39660 [Actinocatenispora thailandica]|uniref:Uncharacterized protein n=1 Tax=Actinocatenispora thailandica TaxID=227318 RepID=A0A7R7DRF1_9ACTN|nr:hypothetical protein [Actinocatenispora thailandica]BCJ36463.1 hypothetical protein Athai_39660 [Actinocatenispora thailandica]
MSASTVTVDAGAVPLLGGELLGESDLDGTDRYGDWLLPLLAEALPATGRTLVLGRYHDSLLTALAARGSQVDLVLRSLPDAAAARVRLAAAGVRVRCGGLDRIPAGSGYDAVLAVDDPVILSGPDHLPGSWPATLATIGALARPGAPVVVLVPNPFGLDRLVHGDAPTTAGPGVDPAGSAAGIDGVPGGVAAVPGVLAAAGLPVRTLLAGYPGLVATATALPPYPEGGDTAAEVPARLIAAGYAAAHAGPALTDPGRLAYQAVRHGLGFPLAPHWIAITTRRVGSVTGTGSRSAAVHPGPVGTEPVGTEPVGTGPAHPEPGRTEPAADGRPPADVTDALDTAPAAIVLADRGQPAYWAVPRVVRRAGAGWRAEPLRPDHSVRLLDHLRRDPRRLTGAVPAGESLADALAAACRHGDLVAVRGLVTGYLGFLGTGAQAGRWRAVWSDDEAGEDPLCRADRVLATCDAVLVGPAPADPDGAMPEAGDTGDVDRDGAGPDGAAGPTGSLVLRLADRSWSSGVAVPVRLVFLRGLQRFAYRLLASGAPHPWPAGLSADRLASTLAATADVTTSARELADAAALAVYLTAPLGTDEPPPAAEEPGAGQLAPGQAVAGGAEPGEHAEAVRYAAGQPRWAADPALATPPPRGYAEALAVIGALGAELADARAQIGWLDVTVAERDRRLSELGTLRRSVTYRVGYLATLPYHLGIRLLRRELRRLRRP